MKKQFNARITRKMQEFSDMGGQHRALYRGKCVVCFRNVYREQDFSTNYTNLYAGEWGNEYDPDPRGIIGANSVYTLVAAEYEKMGADVYLCCICANDSVSYSRGLEKARALWDGGQ